MYTNQNGRLGPLTHFSTTVSSNYSILNNEHSALRIGGGITYANELQTNFFVDEAFMEYTYRNLQFMIGTQHRSVELNGLSSVNGNILFSNNARTLPGVEVKTVRPFSIADFFAIGGSLAHYQTLDDRFVEDAMIHYKHLDLIFNWNQNSTLKATIQHAVQWGGTSPVFGKQPTSFSDYIRVVFGGSGGETARDSDQINALGNSLGSFGLTYQWRKNDSQWTLYHQSLFEDRSGTEANNFPDGVWGVQWTNPDNSWASAVLYEYIQTISQSGRPRQTEGGQQSGGDNYFNNGTYRSGWTYFGRNIGLPFITQDPDGLGFDNNRIIAHHVGVRGQLWKLNYLAKGSYVEGLGTYREPFPRRRKAVYTYLETSYATPSYGTLSLLLGADYLNTTGSNFGAGLQYRYSF
ncbi:capsule assembly Wzi family protein [Croceiramulus getboli]|nr:capsule assembly Wzi family protein [Flavobacteriaceae bacterium YJPT1-3]